MNAYIKILKIVMWIYLCYIKTIIRINYLLLLPKEDQYC